MILAALSLTFVILCWAPQVTTAISFTHATLSTQALVDLKLVQENPWYTGQRVYQKDDAIWLNPDPREVQSLTSNIGRIVYKDPVQFFNSNSTTSGKRVTSFSTRFSFQIITTSAYPKCGSGMAFFISDTEKAPNNSDAGQLGLVDVNHRRAARFFAVEFDTHISPRYEEYSASHIGIDINSLTSVNMLDTKDAKSPYYPELYLYNNYTFSTWIEYDAHTNLIQVWMANTSTLERPLQPILQTWYDLSLVFEEFMYVGFTATNQPSNNSLEGHVLLSWDFNSDDLTDPKSSSLRMVAVISTVLTLLVVCAIIAYCICIWRKQKKKYFVDLDDSINPVGTVLPCFTYTELEIATNAFDEANRIGAGGYSTVYKGTLPTSGSVVAVKKLREHLTREGDFLLEINIISSIRHRNLLQLLGWCYDRGEAMLVYEYMSNGSLDSYLFGRKRGLLPNDVRFKVLVGVANALEYLHNGLPNCVLHRDVKAANVLLTDKWEPLLGDFGLARLITHDEAVTLSEVGTRGYVAPEVVFGKKADEKIDVYSFGVIALEVACGRSARWMSHYEEVRLVEWVWKMNKKNDLMGALDGDLEVEKMPSNEREKWRNVLTIGLMCCHEAAEARPSMSQISQALEGDTLLLPLSLQHQYGAAAAPSGAALHSYIEAPFGCGSSLSTISFTSVSTT